MTHLLERPIPADRIAKALIKRVIGEPNIGRLEQLLFPSRGNAWGGPFNGQERRREIFLALLGSLKPTSIIETGTYFGTTTELFAASGLPVFTVEGDARSYGYAKARLRRLKNVLTIHGDSRFTLRDILPEGKALPTAGFPFVYLDAHWNDDLPLADELDIVFALRPDALVMVDDFEVPDDPKYTFDDYGPGKALTADYIQAAVKKYDLAAFYPVAPGLEETGERRGCVVLAKRNLTGLALQREPLLRMIAAQGDSV
jgi:predicted O-methyltransferase YrrM